jgi:hypothetical protein
MLCICGRNCEYDFYSKLNYTYKGWDVTKRWITYLLGFLSQGKNKHTKRYLSKDISFGVYSRRLGCPEIIQMA